MNIALLTGLRREKLVTLTRHNITDDSRREQRRQASTVHCTPELRAAVDAGLALWPKSILCRSISRSFWRRVAEHSRATVYGKQPFSGVVFYELARENGVVSAIRSHGRRSVYGYAIDELILVPAKVEPLR
jgi:hypothetical protein